MLTLPTLGTRHVLRLSPPLVITHEQVGLALDGLADLCEQIERSAGATLMRGMGWTERARRGDGECVVLPPPAPRAQVVRFRPAPALGVPDPLHAPGGRPRHRSHARVAHRGRDAPPVRPRGAAAAGHRAGGADAALGGGRRGGRLAHRPALAPRAHAPPRPRAHVRGHPGGCRPREAAGRGRRGAGRLHRAAAATAAWRWRTAARPITTGNVLTAALSVQAVEREARRRGLDPRAARVGVVGALGSVGALAARLVARWEPARLVLIGNPASPLGSARGAGRPASRGGTAAPRPDRARRAGGVRRRDLGERRGPAHPGRRAAGAGHARVRRRAPSGRARGAARPPRRDGDRRRPGAAARSVPALRARQPAGPARRASCWPASAETMLHALEGRSRTPGSATTCPSSRSIA